MPSAPTTPASPRPIPLEVLHLSMPRTGSLSMMAAYRILGLSTYHGFDYAARPGDQIEWDRAIDAKFYGKGKPYEREDFDRILGEFAVISDVPAIAFSEELVRMFPEAKVVLVSRDINKWHASFCTNVVDKSYTWMTLILRNVFDRFLAARPATTFFKLLYAMFNATDREGVEQNAQETYRRHYENVRKLVPPERLLEYKLGSGWAPLCEFLGKEVPPPDVEFPWLNESEEFVKWMRQVQINALKRSMRSTVGSLYFQIPLVVGVLAWYLGRIGLSREH
ncbi:hypothetical protein AJ79_01649 [Helicocarpus griseus UAMH5409]|uniref:NAD dependent epimerase/dehydratase n=1 Tax=Helicocarpus griseus UAMH5409 TaxID=1447875 RepID=A0A2B7Y682_9EURO|nr:hypothetical protein AJ79_01649 [Helicocarpus griseus UAMH5409]